MKRVCPVAGAEFEIAEDDLRFYERIGVPPPTLCPDERMRRRLAFRNERSLYHRECNGTGKKIISTYSPDKPLPVYENEYWWSDSWDGRDYARKFDFLRPFFEQFFELVYQVPKMARIQQGEMVNAKFCNCVSYLKNSYLLFSSSLDEDCMYGTWVNRCKSCMDNFNIQDSELCFECVHCENCYNARFLTNCKNCSDSWFLQNCIGCQNCCFSVNLRNKSYYFENKKCNPEEYAAKTEALNLESYKGIRSAYERFQKALKKFPRRYYEGVHNENVSGNYIRNSRNALVCFDVDDVEDCKYCGNLSGAKTCYDVSHYGVSETNELLYEGEGLGHGVFNVLLSKLIWGSSYDVLYSYECFSSHHLFGCVGLKKAEYCILNRRYSKGEYEQLVQKIISHMKETGEWGEFFPLVMSPFGYNETVAYEYMPLTREEVVSRGWKWQEEEEGRKRTGDDYLAPDCIDDVADEVLDAVIICETSGKPYRITQAELEFCRKMHLPIQPIHPHQRHLRRIARRNPRLLWTGSCANCGLKLETTFSPDEDDIVYCEECYLKAVI